MDPKDVEIIEGCYDALRRFAAVVAPWDVDPDDVLHSVLLSVLRKRHLGSLDNPTAYLRRSIINQVNSELRKRATRRSAMHRLGRPETATDQYPSDLADLLRLIPTDRAILYLHDVEGFSFNEIAQLLGMASGRARVRASRARTTLRNVMIEETER